MTDHAAIYIADPSLLGAKFLSQFSEIKDFGGIQQGDKALGLRVDLGVATIKMNFMPAEEIPKHLDGFRGYVRKAGCASEDKLLYTLSRISSVRFVLGCEIEPGWDDKGDVSQFMVDFTSRLNGLLFVNNSVIDYDGEALAGPLREASGPQTH